MVVYDQGKKNVRSQNIKVTEETSMKNGNSRRTFSPGTFILSFVSFMLFINFLFFTAGVITGGYKFDPSIHIIAQLPMAYICAFCTAFSKRRRR